MRLSIIGAGAFGTALAVVAHRSGNDVLLWAHDPDVAATIADTGTNPLYLPDVSLPGGVRATNDLREVAAFSDTILMVVPSHHYRDVLGQLAAHLTQPATILSGTKGIENETLDRMSEVTSAVLGAKLRSFAVLSGPTFAIEAARGDPTVAVIASSEPATAEQAQQMLSSPSFRLYRSEDVIGVELAGSLKNVIAIASGVLEGLGLGSNTNAALITRGLHEITRFGVALGGRPETFAGLAGMGDLVLTCTGALSRNRTVGILLGRGRPIDQILGEMRTVAEGVRTSKSATELARRLGIEMPITTEMYRVLYEQESPQTALQRLMTRSLKAEAAR